MKLVFTKDEVLEAVLGYFNLTIEEPDSMVVVPKTGANTFQIHELIIDTKHIVG